MHVLSYCNIVVYVVWLVGKQAALFDNQFYFIVETSVECVIASGTQFVRGHTIWAAIFYHRLDGKYCTSILTRFLSR